MNCKAANFTVIAGGIATPDDSIKVGTVVTVQLGDVTRDAVVVKKKKRRAREGVYRVELEGVKGNG